MQITHFGHACVLVSGDRRLLLDPGTYATGFEDLRDLDAVLVTHEHPDHLDTDRIPALLAANPAVRVGDVPDGIETVEGEHAVIHPLLPGMANTGYLLDGRIFHPGDAFTPPPWPVRVLLLPVGGPWLKIGEAVDYLRTIEPELVIPIHQAGLAPVHQALHHQLIRNLAPRRTQVEVLEHGVPYTL
ncbi:MBL fold metallo-hydrolase [Nonomuraea guangzhouensis]|uniref:MBL fold metallo-hydrolase n=1 Tax=Nonomuraea guangzhouensis TaxID=1291555 RepID=A0ABW4G879_9ACTN|nr:MBL fold metallo-hydrolase [Nonomuraea guangzhouensis]